MRPDSVGDSRTDDGIDALELLQLLDRIGIPAV